MAVVASACVVRDFRLSPGVPANARVQPPGPSGATEPLGKPGGRPRSDATVRSATVERDSGSEPTRNGDVPQLRGAPTIGCRRSRLQVRPSQAVCEATAMFEYKFGSPAHLVQPAHPRIGMGTAAV
jgi:hypothetical protein